MTNAPRNLALDRLNRTQQSVVDVMQALTTQGRQIIRRLTQEHEQMQEGPPRIYQVQAKATKALVAMQSKVILLGNRVEEAISRALRTNIRLDEMEDQTRPEWG